MLSLAGQVKCFFLTSPFINPIGVAGIEPVQLGQEREDEPPPVCQPLSHGSISQGVQSMLTNGLHSVTIVSMEVE